jgi:hypothetical protein
MIETPIERGFLLLHGWQNHRPAGHWQHWLAGQLTALGYEVAYPQLPDPDHPDLERWLAELVPYPLTLAGFLSYPCGGVGLCLGVGIRMRVGWCIALPGSACG